jgi:hypothetical protein
MLRQTAVDMENTEELISKDDGYSLFYASRRKNLGLGCCLILSYSFFYVLGFYGGYMSDGMCDGSNNLFI